MNPVVLIVDDEKPTRDGLRQALDERFEVYVAADPREAKQVLSVAVAGRLRMKARVWLDVPYFDILAFLT